MSRFSRVDDNRFLFMRYDGSETSMMIPVTEGVDPKEAFIAVHQQQFGFTPVNRKIFVDTLHVRAIGKNFFDSETISQTLESTSKVASTGPVAKPDSIKSVYFKSLGWVDTPVYVLGALSQGREIAGPALIVDNTQTIVVNPNCSATPIKDLLILDVKEEKKSISATILDPVQLSVFRHRFYGIAEQMGRVLQNISVSANIKERLDFSCAIFSPDGSLVANAPHVPAMIGSMGFAVKSQIDEWQGKLRDGDVLLSNSPGMFKNMFSTMVCRSFLG
jgi:5-oxoprolinase (ATP-hydrolysing)